MPKNLNKYIGYNDKTMSPEAVAAGQAYASTITSKKTPTASVAAQAAALSNQTGGNILGFTYE